MSRELPYPLPFDLAIGLEALLADILDREDTVHRIRREAGRIYAQGHQAGRILASTEAYYDKTASEEPTP